MAQMRIPSGCRPQFTDVTEPPPDDAARSYAGALVLVAQLLQDAPEIIKWLYEKIASLNIL